VLAAANKNASHLTLRYLFRVASFSADLMTHRLVLIEVASRAIKRHLRQMLRSLVVRTHFVMFDRVVQRSVVSFLNALFALKNQSHSEWGVVAKEMHDYFGPLRHHRLDGKQLLEEILSIPNGPLLVHQVCVLCFVPTRGNSRCLSSQRLNEQMGFAWAPRIVDLETATCDWLSSQRERLSASTMKHVGVIRRPSLVLSSDRSGALASPRGGSSSLPTSAAAPAPAPTIALEKAAPAKAGRLAPSPWLEWANSTTSFFFDTELTLGARAKLNNLAANALGVKLSVTTEAQDVGAGELGQHFRTLAMQSLEKALMSNPSNPVTLCYLAKMLLLTEAYRVGAKLERNALGGSLWWSSTLRYVDQVTADPPSVSAHSG
jgi:hypothetical protein